MRSDNERLSDIIESCDLITDFVRDISSLARLAQNRRDQSALLYELIKIGEAATHISREIQEAHPHISWAGIKNLRNIIVHQYSGVDWDIVWQVVTVRVPELRKDIQRIIDGLQGSEAAS